MSRRHPVQWGSLRSRAAQSLSSEVDLSLDIRLLMLAMGSANSAGHAYFAEGVEASVEHVNKKTGELQPYKERHAQQVIRSLIYAGALGAQSTRHCLVLPSELWSTTLPIPASPCPVHGHQMRWTRHGWSAEEDEERLREREDRAA